MASTMSWIQIDQNELDSARALLTDLTRGTVDELGFGPIRQFYSRKFFPGTTTNMRGIRYIIFLPAIMELAAKSNETDLVKVVEGLQNRLRECLVRELGQDRSNRIIGARKKDEIERYPLDIYWSALKDLGIIKGNGSSISSLKRLQDFYEDSEEQNSDGVSELVEDQNPVLNEKALEISRRAILDKNGRLKEKIDFELTRDEKELLLDLYYKLDETSLTAFLLSNRIIPKTDLWKLKVSHKDLRGLLNDAFGFGYLAQGAYLSYYMHLAKRYDLTQVQDNLQIDLNHWFDHLKKHFVCQEWDFEAAQKKIQFLLSDIDISFLNQLFTITKDSKSPEDFLNRTYDLLAFREKTKKSDRAKLSGPKDSEFEFEYESHKQITWTQYRAHIGLDYVRDILGEKDE